MKRRDFINTLAALVPATLVTSCHRIAEPGSTMTKSEQSVFDRVMNSGKIRCGYLTYAPNFVKDPNTGEFSGIFYDTMEAIGKALNLKIEWTEEGGVPALIESLHCDRIDVVGWGPWANAERGRVVEFSKPLFYNVLGVYVRPDDNRFNGGLASLNDPSVKIATIDGEMADHIATTDFPKAKKVSLPQMTDFSTLLLSVAVGKADATIAATHEALAYLKHNPGSLKKLDVASPIRVFPNVLFFKKGEQNMASLPNNAIDELYNSGGLESIIQKYEAYPGSFYRVARPYEVARN
jgi:polar amino acid transport system substrate-binding protein